MAENEQLDKPLLKRWQPACAAMRQGCAEVAEQRLRTALYGFVREAVKYLKERGVPLASLLEAAATQPQELRRLLQRCNNNGFASVIVDSALRDPGLPRQELLQSAISRLWERLGDQFAEAAVDASGSAFSNYTDFYEHFGTLLAADRERLARCLAENPEWEPRKPPRPKTAKTEPSLFDKAEVTVPPDEPTLARTKELLGQSLCPLV